MSPFHCLFYITGTSQDSRILNHSYYSQRIVEIQSNQQTEISHSKRFELNSDIHSFMVLRNLRLKESYAFHRDNAHRYLDLADISHCHCIALFSSGERCLDMHAIPEILYSEQTLLQHKVLCLENQLLIGDGHGRCGAGETD